MANILEPALGEALILKARKVGILAPFDRNIGGTYYYQLKLIEGLVGAAPDNWSFVLFCGDDAFSELDLAPAFSDRFSRVSLPVPTTRRKGLERVLMGLYRRSPEFVQVCLGWLYLILVVRVRLKPPVQAVRAAKLDELICTAPDATAAFVGLPYLAIIHDISFYPEMFESDREEVRAYLGVGDQARHIVTQAIAIGATRVVTESFQGRSLICGRYGNRLDRIEVLPTGPASVEQALASDEVRELYDLPERFVFYPGHVHILKNQARVLEALVILQGRGLAIPLVLTSPAGSLDADFQAAIGRMPSGSIRMLGYVPPKHIPGLYRLAFCTCVASYIGPTNMPIWEAMKYGCPVIASQIGDQGWQVGSSEFLFDPDDAEELANLFERFWRDPELGKREVQRLQARYKKLRLDEWRERMVEIFVDRQAGNQR